MIGFELTIDTQKARPPSFDFVIPTVDGVPFFLIVSFSFRSFSKFLAQIRNLRRTAAPIVDGTLWIRSIDDG